MATQATTHEAGWEPLLRTPTHPGLPLRALRQRGRSRPVLETATGPAPTGGIRLHTSVENPGTGGDAAHVEGLRR